MRLDEAFASGLFPDDVVARFAPVDGDEDPAVALPSEEARLVAGAHPRRRAEFATGRRLAREALGALGVPVTALGRDADRVPCWPAESVGCLSHTRRAAGTSGDTAGNADADVGEGLVGAIVARASAYRALGLDIEPDRATSEGIAARVCFGEELDWIGAEAGADPGRRCRVIFSIKEAVYKAFFPAVREVWGFDRVSVVPHLDAEQFTAVVPASTGYTEVSGRVRVRDGWIVSALVLPKAPIGHGTAAGAP